MEKIFKATLWNGRTVWADVEEIVSDAEKKNTKDMGSTIGHLLVLILGPVPESHLNVELY